MNPPLTAEKLTAKIHIAMNGKANLSDGDFLAGMGMDAHKWATAFASMQAGKIIDGGANDDVDDVKVNLGTLIGWFANMIMAGYDRGYQLGVDDGTYAFFRGLEREVVRNHTNATAR
jgi:hypothetical protein